MLDAAETSAEAGWSTREAGSTSEAIAEGGATVILDAQLPQPTSDARAEVTDADPLDAAVHDAGREERSDAAMAPTRPHSQRCGDGIRDPLIEQCDDGSEGKDSLCTADCEATAALAVPLSDLGSSPSERPKRLLGMGSHPLAVGEGGAALAVVEANEVPHELWLYRADAQGRTLPPVLVDGRLAEFGEYADPSVAALGGGQYAITWTAYTETAFDVMLTRVAADASVIAPTIVNTFRDVSQFHSDLAASANELQVVWEEDFDVNTRNEVYSRRYDLELNPLTDADPLATGTAMERGATTVAWSAGVAAAWYSAGREPGAQATIFVESGQMQWTVEPAFGAAPQRDNPALVALRDDLLIALFQTDEGSPFQVDGAVRADRIEYSIVQRNGATTQRAALFPDLETLQTELTAAFDGEYVYVAWNDQPSSTTNSEPQLWYSRARFDEDALALEPEPPRRFVVDDTLEQGRQFRPVLAAWADPLGGGLLGWAWADSGQVLGMAQALPDVWMRFTPTPLLDPEFRR